MNRKKITIIIFISLSITTGIAMFAFKDRSKAEINVVEVNDIVKSLANRWEDLDEYGLPGLHYGMDYVVFDNNNKLIKATRRGLSEDLSSAIRNRDTIVDIKQKDQILGKLVIYNDAKDLWQQYRKQLLTLTLLILFIVAILSLSYIVLIDKKIFRPFRKLQTFAKHVAEGNLDLPLEMDRGNLFGAFTESFDLMREELKRARENERAANQSKKELVASLSHDIKTPVASIKAVSEVLSAKSMNDVVRNQLNIINSKADQINTLITNMFNATLEELQELKVRVTEQSSQLLYDLIHKADYDNQVTVSKIAECIILADELRLEQVIDNIISNSYKYAGTSIDVTARITAGYLEVIFRDYGLGVSEEERPLLFNKFYRAKNAENKSGTGLGLYISKYLMNKMSGEIDCENTESGFLVKIKLLLA
ncbi:HAMP domain-containing histidine kinase [Mobilitalea sibirica]|uniref:histidine kinase n=1 Tax=Mobilitalea sibirica TaxID=1462919 RepID=A0A8J7H3U0_9FIRM|nr:HAMP domain-containing sensor histidine kinase [Mobilitalea sibirica]MBH1941745.1 HAMP domain-containing histidine kinase [Mobilitalea sibirica]